MVLDIHIHHGDELQNNRSNQLHHLYCSLAWIFSNKNQQFAWHNPHLMYSWDKLHKKIRQNLIINYNIFSFDITSQRIRRFIINCQLSSIMPITPCYFIHSTNLTNTFCVWIASSFCITNTSQTQGLYVGNGRMQKYGSWNGIKSIKKKLLLNIWLLKTFKFFVRFICKNDGLYAKNDEHNYTDRHVFSTNTYWIMIWDLGVYLTSSCLLYNGTLRKR